MKNYFLKLSTPVTIIFLGLAIFFGFIFYTSRYGPLPFNILSSNKDLTVEGRGEAIGIPNAAHISFGITKTAPTVDEAKSQVNTITDKMKQELKKLGIEEQDIKITVDQILPNYENYQQIGDSAKITGFMVNRLGEVTVKSLNDASHARDIILASGASPNGGIIFIVDKEGRKKVIEEARKKAAEDAREKAQKLSKSAGLRLGRSVAVHEQSAKYIDNWAVVFVSVTYNTY